MVCSNGYGHDDDMKLGGHYRTDRSVIEGRLLYVKQHERLPMLFGIFFLQTNSIDLKINDNLVVIRNQCFFLYQLIYEFYKTKQKTI